MSANLRLVIPPIAEPVTLGQLKGILRLQGSDTSWDQTLSLFLTAARQSVENYCRTALITQTWLFRLDSFPGISARYDRNGFPQILLPKPPFQSIDSFVYVDTAGATQTLTRDTSYGANLAEPFYGYQLDPGGGMVPAALVPPWARPWPPQRMVPMNTTVQFRCGYGGPLPSVTTIQGNPVISTPGFTFNQDDAPAVTGDTGTKICIPGAGADGAALVTNVASVDVDGNATLAVAPSTATTTLSAWLGDQVPYAMQLAILFQAQFYFEQGAVSDQPAPRVIDSLRNSGYRNLVS